MNAPYQYINVVLYYPHIVASVIYVSSCDVCLSHLQNIFFRPSTVQVLRVIILYEFQLLLECLLILSEKERR